MKLTFGRAIAGRGGASLSQRGSETLGGNLTVMRSAALAQRIPGLSTSVETNDSFTVGADTGLTT